MNTIIITAQIEFVTEDDLYPFRCSLISSCVTPGQVETSVARRLAVAWKDTGTRSEGAACVWIEANQAVGSTHTLGIMCPLEL
ncbi:hypothetical protein TNCV_2119131 [Trichonephila clavipes]|nr:hypothetical protein TNCV_2119131 [Trichonephila clavipes]